MASSFSGLTWQICTTGLSDPPGFHGVTDSNGFYRLAFFPATANLSISPPAGSIFAPAAIAVDITNDTTRDIVLQLPTHIIRGRIVDSNSNPITGVTVALSGSQSAISTTDGNGNYIFVNVSEGGNYTVTPFRTSYQFNPANAVFNNLIG